MKTPAVPAPSPTDFLSQLIDAHQADPPPKPTLQLSSDPTPVTDFGTWWAKREDYAAFQSPLWPSGSKVRQFLAMAAKAPGAPMIVGCAAASAMQIYVAASAKQSGVAGIIYVPGRKEPTSATQWAIDHGAEIVSVYPGYKSVYRKRAKERSIALGKTVRWDVPGALRDTAAQCGNLPPKTKRVVVPTGSGLTAAGVLAGLTHFHKCDDGLGLPEVYAVAVSPLASFEGILKSARSLTDKPLPKLTLVRAPLKYEQWTAKVLPNGWPLDPYYAAKALDMVVGGDCLWVSGLRPVAASPVGCRAEWDKLGMSFDSR